MNLEILAGSRKKAAIAAMILMAWALSCAPSGAASKTKRYASATYGFQFRYPAEWQEVKVGGSGLVLFSGGGPKVTRQISVAREEGGEKEIEAHRAQFKAMMVNAKQIRGEWREVNGRRAYLEAVSWDSPLGKNKALRLYMPVGDRFFVVKGVVPLDEFDHYASLLEDCVTSFEVNSP